MNKLSITLFGDEADFFLNHKVRISNIQKLNREGRSAITITFDVIE
jgi:hypothetical protein